MCFACGDFQYSRSDLLHSAVALGAPKSKTVKDYTALLTGRSWVSHETLKTTKSPVFLTYSFPLKINKRDKIGDPEGADSWRAFSRSDQQEAKAALKQWGDACGIKFIEVKNQKGDIQFNWWNTGSFNSGIGYKPSVYSAYAD
jgi:hypothetical protein